MQEERSEKLELEELRQRCEELSRERRYYKRKAVELDNRVFQMRALLQSGKGFSELLHLRALLDAFMAVCRERYGAINSTVMLLDDLDPEDVFYRVRAFHGLPKTYHNSEGETEELLLFRVPHNNGLLWQVVHQAEVFSVRGLDRKPRFETAFREWSLEILGSDVWVPLVRGGQVLGVLTLGERYDGSRILDAEFDFLDEIAAVAATSIDSTLKYEKNARILSNLRTLYDINQQLANVNDFKQLTIETLSTAVSALSAQKANLMLYNSETERLEIKVVWGNIPKHTRDAINEGQMSTKSFAIGEGVAGTAAELRRAVRVNDRNKIEQVGRNMAHCILSAPLIYGGVVMGVMTLTNKVKPSKKAGEEELELDTLGRFGQDDEQLLLSLADQAAVNLHKARLYNASITDRLTGLFNARHFESSLGREINSCLECSERICLAVADIDHFKRLNDTYGHQAGDFVLIQTAKLLKQMRRESKGDRCFRYGGEEFCMLMPQTEPQEALELMERYRQLLAEQRFEYEGEMLQVQISIGVACAPCNASNGRALFEAADQALYQSKSGGRNRVTLSQNLNPDAEISGK